MALQVKGYSDNTISARRRDLSVFLRWAHDRGLLRSREVTKPALVQYQRHLFHLRKPSGERTATSTQAARLSAVKQLFAWLTKSDRILANPAADLEMPKVVRQAPRDVLTAAEAETVLNVPDTDDALGVRDRAILEVLYSTGVRRLELVKLSVYDLDEGRGCLHVRKGKGGKSRTIPIGERAMRWTRRYLDDVRPLLLVDPAELTLFLTTNGEPLSKAWLSETVRAFVDASGVPKKGSCHLFRHTMATLMLEGGADIRYVQAMLGHAALSTTEIYTHVAVDKLRQVHAATHPAKMMPERHDDDDQAEPQEDLIG